MTDGWQEPDNLYGQRDLCPGQGDLQKLHLILDSRSFMASCNAPLSAIKKAERSPDDLCLDTTTFIISNVPQEKTMRQEGKRLREKTATKMATNPCMGFQATPKSQTTRLDPSAVTKMLPTQCCPLWSLWNPTRCPMGKFFITSKQRSLFRVIILLPCSPLGDLWPPLCSSFYGAEVTSITFNGHNQNPFPDHH